MYRCVGDNMDPDKNFKLEAVTVCVNYSDFLAVTLPHNKGLFDRFVVVTDTQDLDTKRVCDENGVKCIQTDVFYEDGNPLNKAKGINKGLEWLDTDAWILHFDADCLLPPLTRAVLSRLPLDPKGIYGIDRLMCKSYHEFEKYTNNPTHIHQDYCYINLTAFPLGRRLGEYYNTGYTPIGFWQMWNPKKSHVYEYPTEHGCVDRSDVLFAKKFCRYHRHLIPELACIHLESEDAPQGTNWKGRKSKKFKAPDPVVVEVKVERHLPSWFTKIFGKRK